MAPETSRTAKVSLELNRHLTSMLHASLWQVKPPSDSMCIPMSNGSSQSATERITFYLCASNLLEREKCTSVLDSVRNIAEEKLRTWKYEVRPEVHVSVIHHCDRYVCQSNDCDCTFPQCSRPMLVLEVPCVNFISHHNHMNCSMLSDFKSLLVELENKLLTSVTCQLLVEGGDDRLCLNDNGVNKYYCPPYPVNPGTTFLRSSCTCSPPTKDGFERACAVVRNLWKQESIFSSCMEDVRRRIVQSLKLNDHETFCILHPSGSDAELLPLLVAIGRMERLDSYPIVNIVSAAGEVGSGTAPAAAGKHFSTISPSGYKVKQDTTISSFPTSTLVVQLSPRGKDGTPVNFDNLVREQMREIGEKYRNAVVIFHAVDGSKTGLKLPSHEVIEELQHTWGQRLVVVLDACQGRSDFEEYRWFLRKGGLVLLTGSKFFGGPGFCGAVLFSSSVKEELERLSSIPDGISFYITKNEVAESMKHLRSKLPSLPRNIGLLLRWECALTEMERWSDIVNCNAIVDRWSRGVRTIVENHFSFIRVLMDEDWSEEISGMNSILNLIVYKKNGEVMNLNELKMLHKMLASCMTDVIRRCWTEEESSIAYRICLIGQPVKLGDKSVIRLALGASQIRAVHEGKCTLEDLLQEDWKILEKLQLLMKYWEEILSNDSWFV